MRPHLPIHQIATDPEGSAIRGLNSPAAAEEQDCAEQPKQITKMRRRETRDEIHHQIETT